MATSGTLNGYLRTYLGASVENTPLLMQHFLGGFAATDPIWDERLGDDRFSLREMIAHIADWNDIYLERFTRTLNEDHPLLPNCDEGQIAINRDYAHSNPEESLSRFSQTRKNVTAFIETIQPEDWDRMAEREGVGPLNLTQHVLLMMGHDAYHVRQAMDTIYAYDTRIN